MREKVEALLDEIRLADPEQVASLIDGAANQLVRDLEAEGVAERHIAETVEEFRSGVGAALALADGDHGPAEAVRAREAEKLRARGAMEEELENLRLERAALQKQIEVLRADPDVIRRDDPLWHKAHAHDTVEAERVELFEAVRSLKIEIDALRRANAGGSSGLSDELDRVKADRAAKKEMLAHAVAERNFLQAQLDRLHQSMITELRDA